MATGGMGIVNHEISPGPFVRHCSICANVRTGLGSGAFPWVGGTDSLSLGTNCSYSPPFLDKRQPLVLLPPNSQPPLFMDAQGQPSTLNDEFAIFNVNILPYYCFKRVYEQI